MRREARGSVRLRRNKAGTRRQGKCTDFSQIIKTSGESWSSYHKDGKTIWRRLLLWFLMAAGILGVAYAAIYWTRLLFLFLLFYILLIIPVDTRNPIIIFLPSLDLADSTIFFRLHSLIPAFCSPIFILSLQYLGHATITITITISHVPLSPSPHSYTAQLDVSPLS